MKFIKDYLKTILSLIKIYFKTKNKKKNLIFYFPVKIYQTNIVEITRSLNKKFNVFLIYNSQTKNEIIKEKNSMFLDFNLLKFIVLDKFFLKNISHFFSSYLSYVYPPNSTNVYISHDIYDAPMIDTKFEKELFIRINKLDYIFVSSNISKKYFLKKFKKYKLYQNPKLFNTGYLKLDHLINFLKKRKKKKENKKIILLAPGYFYAYKKYNMMLKIEEIIKVLLKSKEFKIIFRPHPLDLTKKGNFNLVNTMNIKFKKYKNFKLDDNVSYNDSYINSDILITDLSSTAYTYCFSTLKPVLFFSRNEAKLRKQFFFKTYYFLDRKKIGTTINKVKLIPNLAERYISKKNHFREKIRKLRKQRIEYLHFSKRRTIEAINKIV
tara:strand:+ start:673 stop:1812 length:1140 start_codon:yes stop_codon:yes gene_type:complete